MNSPGYLERPRLRVCEQPERLVVVDTWMQPRVALVMRDVVNVQDLFSVVNDLVPENPVNIVWAIKIEVLSIVVKILLQLAERSEAQPTGASVKPFCQVIVESPQLCREADGRLPWTADGVEQDKVFGGFLLARACRT